MEIITAEQAAEAAKGLTFETVWYALMENRLQQEKTELLVQKTQEQIDKTQRSIDDYIKSAKKAMDDLSKNIGGLGNTLEILTEEMFATDLWKKFCDLGFKFSGQSKQYKFCDDKRVLAEADYYLENGEYVMLVEVQTVLDLEHVNDHLKRIEKVRRYMDARGDRRKIVGAVAGGAVPENVLKYAQKQGFYVIIQSGEIAMIADTPEGFKAREWELQEVSNKTDFR